MLVAWRTALYECCQIYAKLPCAEMSVIGGDGARYFYQPSTANVLTICPRLHDGTRAAYVCPDDVQLVVSDATHRLLRAQVQPSMGSDGNITLRFTLDENCNSPALRVCVRVCGVLLADVWVQAAFDARTAGRRCGQHTLPHSSHDSYIFYAVTMAIHPAGTHLVTSTFQKELAVYGLPDMNLLATIGSKGNGGPVNLKQPICFTDAGTLLVLDYYNKRVQHWALEGSSIASYAMQTPPVIVASRGNLFAVGTESGVRVCLLESGVVLHEWSGANRIHAVAFVDAETLAVSISSRDIGQSRGTVGLYTLDGRLLKLLANNIALHGHASHSLATRADGCLLVSDYNYFSERIRVFAPDGIELTTSPLALQRFQSYLRSIAFCGGRVYVLEVAPKIGSKISVFE